MIEIPERRNIMNITEYAKEYQKIEKAITSLTKDIYKTVENFLLMNAIYCPIALTSANTSVWISILLILGGSKIGYKYMSFILELLHEREEYLDAKQLLFEQTDIHVFLEVQKETILNHLKELYQETNITSLIPVQATFIFLLKGGYLSYNHEWHYEIAEDLHYKHLTLALFKGEGCCRNIIELLVELETKLGFDVDKTFLYTRQGFVTDCLVSRENYQDIYKTTASLPSYLKDHLAVLSEERFVLWKDILNALKKEPNHVVASTTFDQTVNHFDATNHCYLENAQPNHLKYYHQSKSMRAYCFDKNKISSRVKNQDIDEIKTLYNSFFVQIIPKYEKQFQQFYEENCKNYATIKKIEDEVLALRKKC